MSDSIAFIGARDTVAGFTPLGVEAHPVDGPAAASRALRRCVRAGVAIVFVTEPVAEMLEEELAALRFEPTPAVLVVPSMTSTGGGGIERLRALVEKAIGADILSRNDSGDPDANE